jgi:hypothetical protein
MRPVPEIVGVGLVVATCGEDGGGSKSYEAGVTAQTRPVIEMVEGFERITDTGSANRATIRIEDLGSRLAEVSTKMAALSRPNAQQMQRLSAQPRVESKVFYREAKSAACGRSGI